MVADKLVASSFVKELKSTRLLVETPVWFVAAFGESLPIAAKSIDTVT